MNGEKYEFDKVTSRDKVNYVYILGCRMLNIQEAEKLGDSNVIEQCIVGLLSDIPEDIRDKQFLEDVEASKYPVYRDNRSEWCGMRMGKKVFKDNPNAEEERNRKINQVLVGYRYYSDKLKHACINLLNRKGMLLKEDVVEKFP